MINEEMKQLMEIRDTGEDSLEFRIIFPSSFSAFKGHFPENSILPGVVQLMTVQAAMEKKLGLRMILHEISNAKFKAPVLPGEEIMGTLHFILQESACEVSCSLQHGADKKSDLKLNFHCEKEAGN